MTAAYSVAFVSPRFAAGATVGGAETLLRRLAERLSARGWPITYFTTCAEDHATWRNTLPAGCRRHGALDVCYFPVDETRDVNAFLRAQEIISRGGRVDAETEAQWLQNSVCSAALLQALRAGAERFARIVTGPYLFGLVHAASRVAPEKTLLVPCLHDEPFAHLPATHRLVTSVRGLLFNSPPERDLAERLCGIPRERSALVGMGLEPFHAEPHVFPERHGLRRPYVLYAGRREPSKGTPLLCDYLNAFRQRTGTDLTLVLTGSGRVEPPPELRRHVFDAGLVPEEEKREAMAGALAFVHPSVYESLGIVLLESWMAGVPALVHAGSAVLTWQCRQSGGGLWFRDYPEFETELLLLLRDPALRRAMGEAGRRYVLREYGWEAVEQRLLDALARL